MSKKSPISKAIIKILADKPVETRDSLKDRAMGLIEPKNELKSKTEYAISRTLKKLLDDGLVEELHSENHQYIRLTKSGREKQNLQKLESESSLVSTTWDGFWRIILLDLPEERKKEREALRYLLKKAGFVCVKNAVWVSMYPFEHLFTNIKNDLGLTTELIIIVTDKIDEATEKSFTKYFQ